MAGRGKNNPPRWKWVQVPDFKHPDHPEWDLIQWDLEDELVKGPRKISHPVYDEPTEWWYMKAKNAPGLQHLPPIIVLFRIAQEPSGDEPGIIEGWEAWGDDLVTTLMRAIQRRPSF
ncbi:MAG: hypothetical protein E6G22_00120 [Actinobacteria bacterium]|nr:MAG: hypothetical protein E6G22_00120 [Actinomycetota bacterium]